MEKIYIDDNYSVVRYGELIKSMSVRKDPAVVYVFSFSKTIIQLIEALLSLGYTDITEKGGRCKTKEFRYIICKNSRAIKLYVKIRDKVGITFINFSNIVSGNKTEIIRDFGGSSLTESMKIAIEELYNNGMTDTNTTIGGVCMKAFKNSIDYDFDRVFSLKIYKEPALPFMRYCENIADFVRLSYSGGWNYINPRYQNKIIDCGLVFDDNSLYPYCLEAFDYPIGLPIFKWQGEEPTEVKDYEDWTGNVLYRFYMIKAMFHVKRDKFPFIKIKNDLRFRQNEIPERVDFPVTLVLTETDFLLFEECYEIDAIEHLGGVAFLTKPGKELFGDYIDRFYKIKSESKGVRKKTSKLLLNNLGGKFGGGTDSTHYIYDETKPMHIRVVFGNDRQGQYIPVASAMTAYARKITITGAIANADRFIYSDTDSLHLSGIEEPKGIIINNNIGRWKIEAVLKNGYYSGLKVYSYETDKKVEYITETDIVELNTKFVNAGYTDAEKLKIIEHARSINKLPAEIVITVTEEERKVIRAEIEDAFN